MSALTDADHQARAERLASLRRRGIPIPTEPIYDLDALREMAAEEAHAELDEVIRLNKLSPENLTTEGATRQALEASEAWIAEDERRRDRRLALADRVGRGS